MKKTKNVMVQSRYIASLMRMAYQACAASHAASGTTLCCGQNLIMGLYEDYKRDILSKDNYLMMKKNYEKISDEILDEIKVLDQNLNDIIHNINSNNKWIETFKNYKNIEKLNRSVLIALIDRIEIVDKQHIQIYYNFADEINKTLRFIETVSNLDGTITEKFGEIKKKV